MVKSPEINEDIVKKKHKKEHKHKHKKHSGDKSDRKKHKKHKKHHHKRKNEDSDNDKNDRYTPELSPKPKIPKATTVNNITNGKSCSGTAKEEINAKKMEVNEVVDYIASGLSNTHSLEIISSESEDAVPEVDCDSDAIDDTVIEADMDLEELMKQKELLQMEIAKASTDVESDAASIELNKKNGKISKEVEVILLDDSSNDSSYKRKKDKSPSRERRIVIEKREYIREVTKRRRTTSRDRNKDSRESRERYRENYREIRMSNRDRDRDYHRSRTHEMYNRRSIERNRSHREYSRDRDLKNNHRSREREINRSRENDLRHRSRSRDVYRKYSNFNRDRGRTKQDGDRSRDRRDKHRIMKKSDKPDKYKDSLSEGLKKNASSDSDELDIDINDDEEDEQQIIEKRRRQREELLKVCSTFFIKRHQFSMNELDCFYKNVFYFFVEIRCG